MREKSTRARARKVAQESGIRTDDLSTHFSRFTARFAERRIESLFKMRGPAQPSRFKNDLIRYLRATVWRVRFSSNTTRSASSPKCLVKSSRGLRHSTQQR